MLSVSIVNRYMISVEIVRGVYAAPIFTFLRTYHSGLTSSNSSQCH